MEVPTARFVDGAGEGHGVPGPGPHLVPQPRPAGPREEAEEEGAEEQCWGETSRALVKRVTRVWSQSRQQTDKQTTQQFIIISISVVDLDLNLMDLEKFLHGVSRVRKV